MNFELNPTLQGQLIQLRPLREEDFEVLYAVASDPLIWEQHPQKDRYKRPVFENFFKTAMESKGAFLVYNLENNEVIGSSRFYDFNPETKQVAIGYSFLARPYWGHKHNAEMKGLMLAHAFQFVDSVIFHIGENNIRSRKAIEKIGARLVLRASHTLPDGTPYDEVIYQYTKVQKFLSST